MGSVRDLASIPNLSIGLHASIFCCYKISRNSNKNTSPLSYYFRKNSFYFIVVDFLKLAELKYHRNKANIEDSLMVTGWSPSNSGAA
jgi:hypothetical protein